MDRDFSGPIIVTAIGAIGLASLVNADFGATLSDRFEDGKTQPAIEGAFDDALVITEGAIQAWNAVRYGLFGEALAGAVPGQDGWLFTDEEYTAPADYDAIRAENMNAIISIVTQLNAMGVEVIIVLLPDKARVVQDKLARRRPAVLDDRYSQTLMDLQDADVTVVDPYEALATLHEQSGEAFMARDTHWSPEGAHAVAQLVAPQIQTLTTSRSSFTTEIARTEAHQGDLVKFADAGAMNSALGLDAENVDIYVTTQSGADSAASLFGDAAIPVTLVGTSYSAISTWNFDGFLMQESQTDVLNKAQEGAGPFAPMQSYILELESGSQPPEIIVWEIPERYLTTLSKGSEQ